MKKTILILLSLCLISCGGFLKGCYGASDNIIDDIGRALKKAPDSFEGDTHIAKLIKSYDFDNSRSLRILDSDELRKVYENVLEQCEKLKWKVDLKWHLREIEKQNHQENYLQKELTSRVKKLFNRELLRISPVKIELETLDADVKLSVDTPCGTEHFAKPVNDSLDNKFKEIFVTPFQSDKQQTKLRVGTWREVVKDSVEFIDIIVVGETEYTADGTYVSNGDVNVIYNKEDSLIYASSFVGTGEWEIRNGILYDTTRSIRITNVQDPANLFPEFQESLKETEGERDSYEIVLLTSKASIVNFDNDGKKGTIKAVKIN